MLTKVVMCLILLVGAINAQPPTPVIVSPDPNVVLQSILVYSSNLLVYVCDAVSQQKNYLLTVSAASNANPVSLTATAHGLDYQSGATTTFSVFISGATGNWTPINGMFIATPTGANTFTIPVDSTTFGALTGTLVVTARAPRTTSLVWRIRKLVYDSSSNLIWTGWAVDTSATNYIGLQGGSGKFGFACASRAAYAFE